MSQKKEIRNVHHDALVKELQDVFMLLGKSILHEPTEFTGLSCKPRPNQKIEDDNHQYIKETMRESIHEILIK